MGLIDRLFPGSIFADKAAKRDISEVQALGDQQFRFINAATELEAQDAFKQILTQHPNLGQAAIEYLVELRTNAQNSRSRSKL